MAYISAGQWYNQSLSNNIMVLLAKIVSNINLITLTILAKSLILDAWLGLGCAPADEYITVLKFQMKICRDGRQVKKELHLILMFLLLTITILSLSHKPTFKNNYQMYLSGTVLEIFVRKFSANYYQSIFGRVYV